MTLDALLEHPPYGLSQAPKAAALLPLLQELTLWHRARCPAYDRIARLTAPEPTTTLEDLPYLPVSLFKFRRLQSVPDSEVRVTVQSSGTSGTRSRIALDADNARRSARALASCLTKVTGGPRLPMLIIDTPSAVQGRDTIGARAAAILGLMPYGRDHVFALDDALQWQSDKVAGFLERHGGQRFLIYGFTFLIWQALLTACRAARYDLSQGVLLHSGGWKALHKQAIDNAVFRQQLHDACGVEDVRNFYGMAELPGTIFLEGDDGLLYPPNFSSVIIRDPVTRRPLEDGKTGLIEIISALPRSYPGHVLLTEDMGVVERVDGAELQGQGLRIIGRAPRAEMRGCSDVLAGAAT